MANVCMYAALFRLSSGIVTQTARCTRRRESVPCRKKLSHHVIFFCGKLCNFFAVNVWNKKTLTLCNLFLAVNACTKKSSSRVFFSLR